MLFVSQGQEGCVASGSKNILGGIGKKQKVVEDLLDLQEHQIHQEVKLISGNPEGWIRISDQMSYDPMHLSQR